MATTKKEKWTPNPDPMFDDFSDFLKWKAEQDKKAGKAKTSETLKKSNLHQQEIKRLIEEENRKKAQSK